MNTSDFDYDLPPELIAQEPLPDRASSRMMVLHRSDGRLEHGCIGDLPHWLRAGDLLVVNNTRVFPARLFGVRADTGGRVELLLIEDLGGGRWTALFRASSRARVGLCIQAAEGRLRGDIVAVGERGQVVVQWVGEESLADILARAGSVPLPPYIRRNADGDVRAAMDRERYQTVYAREVGAVAAPTAGLHFSSPLLRAMEETGIGRAEITLHVGPGTFRPVQVDHIEDHVMDEERYVVEESAATAIGETRARGGRVVAVGSTTVRTLETVCLENSSVVACTGRSRLFIRPPFSFRVVDAILTNFHLPKSSLIMMISAFAGHENVMRAYAVAVREKYRFYSYGDCMLIL